MNLQQDAQAKLDEKLRQIVIENAAPFVDSYAKLREDAQLTVEWEQTCL